MQENNILFSIKDDEIGVLKEKLQSIFGVFVVSSKTLTPAGSRGVGLCIM
ncbi:ATP-binding protein [Rickettsia massiliae]|nr:ATP-binding protein [Rickettsia massiliae]